MGFENLFSGLAGAVAGIYANERTNETNSALARRQLQKQDMWRSEDYARFLSNRDDTWQREDMLLADQRAREDALRAEEYARADTSYQRSAADARAAGLSPLSVSQLNSAGTPITSSYSGTSSSTPPVATGMPASYMAQSPAQDIATLVGAVVSQKNIDEIARHNKATEEQAAKELDFQSRKTNEELLQQSNQFNQRLEFDKSQADAQTNQFMMTYQQNASQFTARLAQDKQFHLDDLRGKSLDRALEDMHSVNKQNYDSAVDFAKSLGMPYVTKFYTSDEKYNNAMSDLKNIMIKGNRKVTNDIDINPDKYWSTDSSSHSESQANGVSASGSPLHYLGNDTGAAASAQKSTSQSDSYSLSKSDRALQQEIQKLYGSVLEIPIRVYDWDDYEKHYSKYK